MSDIHKSTRLGDLLVERGTLTRHQLMRAIETQQERLFNAQHGEDDGSHKELGEILIELGFINRSQLDSGLTWQRKLRKTTLVMAFIAPLLTAACGGGASGSTNNNNNTQSNAVSSQSIQSPDSTPKPGMHSSSSSSQQSLPSPVQTSSAPAAVSSSSAALSSAASSQASSAAQHVGPLDGPAVIYWSIPTQRENGEYLDIREIGGYEVRYKLKSATDFETVTIDSGYTDTYYFDYLQGDYEFEIATFDVDGLYSNFVSIRPVQ
ncbi:hypothetical protein ACSV5M_08615 [Cellvibrio sp. ARAG 10.3]|uniref:hypothetical protein n=1 Tax=Cellvibrio sp. ARAG 10.3 TaxID=3451358 RepID=UPI003F456BB9